MWLEENKQLVRRVFEQIWNQGKVELVDQTCTPDYVFHTPVSPYGPDREGYKKFVLNVRKAFPDVHFTIEDLVAEDDKVMYRYTFTGTNTGQSANLPATGKPVNCTGFGLIRLRDGQMVEEWWLHDHLLMRQQLGLIDRRINK